MLRKEQSKPTTDASGLGGCRVYMYARGHTHTHTHSLSGPHDQEQDPRASWSVCCHTLLLLLRRRRRRRRRRGLRCLCHCCRLMVLPAARRCHCTCADVLIRMCPDPCSCRSRGGFPHLRSGIETLLPALHLSIPPPLRKRTCAANHTVLRGFRVARWHGSACIMFLMWIPACSARTGAGKWIASRSFKR